MYELCIRYTVSIIHIENNDHYYGAKKKNLYKSINFYALVFTSPTPNTPSIFLSPSRNYLHIQVTQ